MRSHRGKPFSPVSEKGPNAVFSLKLKQEYHLYKELSEMVNVSKIDHGVQNSPHLQYDNGNMSYNMTRNCLGQCKLENNSNGVSESKSA